MYARVMLIWHPGSLGSVLVLCRNKPGHRRGLQGDIPGCDGPSCSRTELLSPLKTNLAGSQTPSGLTGAYWNGRHLGIMFARQVPSPKSAGPYWVWLMVKENEKKNKDEIYIILFYGLMHNSGKVQAAHFWNIIQIYVLWLSPQE